MGVEVEAAVGEGSEAGHAEAGEPGFKALGLRYKEEALPQRKCGCLFLSLSARVLVINLCRLRQ